MRKRLPLMVSTFYIILSFAPQMTSIPAIALEWPLVSIETSTSKALFRVEIAGTSEEISRGLMFRESLEDDKGMLFVFPNERNLSVWMKNTTFPLDVIFADSEGEIVGITAMEPCSEDPCPVYSSPESSRYALEISGGLAEAYNITPGSRMTFHFDLPEDFSLRMPAGSEAADLNESF